MGEVPVYHRELHGEQMTPEVWYPRRFKETYYLEPNQPGESSGVETWARIALTDVRVKAPIPGEQFGIEALGLARDEPDVTVMRTTVNGRMIPYLSREGKLVPRD